ncbi:MAG: C4-dicarboxylate ABC transporter, partial [Thermoplasmata archaeon]
MGTGILAMTSLFYSRYIPFLKNLAYILFYFNIILFFVLLIPWILRWIFFRKEALNDLEHPVLSNFYATIAIGMLVLAADFIVIGKN